LGTGVSTAVPNLQHVINQDSPRCAVCIDAFTSPGSKNKRNNVSIAILFEDSNQENKCVVIDVGKTMRDACMTQFPKFGISSVNAIVLTHGHADAVFGLDDVRDLQISRSAKVTDSEGVEHVGFKVVSGPITVHLTEETMRTVKQCFSYLTNEPDFLDREKNIIERRIAYLKFDVIDPNSSFLAAGLPIKSFPVYHGGKYISLGFSIGKPGEFVYISDVKIIPEESMRYLMSLPRIKVFVIDVLNTDGIFAHMGLNEAIEIVKILNPHFTYFTGMTCSIGLHDEIEAQLAKSLPNAYYAFDGLQLGEFDLF
jgi:phosphoribosyl 1,2-cyclic phosphodiesterase